MENAINVLKVENDLKLNFEYCQNYKDSLIYNSLDLDLNLGQMN